MKRLRMLILISIILALTSVTYAASISVSKEVDPLTPNTYHRGDIIHYVIVVENPSATYELDINSISDTLPDGSNGTGLLVGPTPPYRLASNDGNPGTGPDSASYTLDWTVPNDQAAGPVVNRFDANGNQISPPVGDKASGTAFKTSLIIIPCINVNKTVEPTVAVVDEVVTYDVNICNCGDTALTLTAVDDNVGGVITSWIGEVLPEGIELDIGECTSFQVPYPIQDTDPDPLCNVVTAVGEDFLGKDVNDQDPACVDILEPNIMIEKSCDEYSKVGDEITYEVCITNIGDTDLQILSVDDDVAGPQSGCVDAVLVPDANCCFSYYYTVQQNDLPGPLINTVEVNSFGFKCL